MNFAEGRERDRGDPNASHHRLGWGRISTNIAESMTLRSHGAYIYRIAATSRKFPHPNAYLLPYIKGSHLNHDVHTHWFGHNKQIWKAFPLCGSKRHGVACKWASSASHFIFPFKFLHPHSMTYDSPLPSPRSKKKTDGWMPAGAGGYFSTRYAFVTSMSIRKSAHACIFDREPQRVRTLFQKISGWYFPFFLFYTRENYQNSPQSFSPSSD